MGVLVSCVSASEAVARALASSSTATAIAVRQADGGPCLELGTVTPFGPVVRRWSPADHSFIDAVIGDTVRAAGQVFVFARRDDDGRFAPFAQEGAVFAAFDGAKPVPPAITDGGMNYATWWSIAQSPDGEDFDIGDVLTLHEERDGARTELRYRGRDGRDAGLHVVLDRELGDEERRIVQATEAIVQRCAFGVGLENSGDRYRTQTLVLRIPLELATSFDDGKAPLPRPSTNSLENAHV